MKILVTGSTATQGGRPNSTGFVSAPVLLVKALRDHGHKVEWRPVVPGEDLKSYKRVISFLTPPLTFGSLHYYGALWALTHPKAIAAVDDWRFMTIVSQAASCHREPWRLWESPPAMNRKGEERKQALKLKKTLEVINFQVTHGKKDTDMKMGWPWPIAAPLFDWWDPAKFPLQTYKKIYAYDPTPLMPRPKKIVQTIAAVSKTWLLASLSNHQPWLDKLMNSGEIKWPVAYVGGTAKLRKSGYALPAVKEEDLFPGWYHSYPATLCPPYPHAGSGWWRARIAHAAWAGCVTVGFEKELARATLKPNDPPHHGPFQFNPASIEGSSVRELEDIAREQLRVVQKRCTLPALNAAISDLINLR